MPSESGPTGTVMSKGEIDSEQERGCPTQQLTIGVIGMPGQGKSTVLNTIFEAILPDSDVDEDLFVAGAAGESCTKESKEAWIRLDIGKEHYIMILIDTPGFPDPDPRQAAKFFDDVVENVVNRKKGLHALIWVVKQDRVIEELIAKYKVLMGEFKPVRCEMLMLLNGFENFAGKTGGKLKTARAKATGELKGYALGLLESVDLQTKIIPETDLIVSTDKTWLSENLVPELLQRTMNADPQISEMRSVRDVVVKFSSAEALLQASKYDIAAQIVHLEQQIAVAEASLKKTAGGSALVVGATAAAVILLPFVGAAVAAVNVAAASLGTGLAVAQISIKKSQLENLKKEQLQSQEVTMSKIAKEEEDFNVFAQQFGGVDVLKATYLTTPADVLDEDKNGIITRAEWEAGFDAMDTDKDGCISRKEWYLKGGATEQFEAIQKKTPSSPVLTREQWLNHFDTLDPSGVGSISRDEFESMPEA